MDGEPKYLYVKFSGLGSSDDEDSEKKPKKTKSKLVTGLEGLQKALNPQSFLEHNKNDDIKMYFGKEAANRAIDTLATVTEYSVSRYFRLSEDYKSENYLNNVMGNINRAKSFGLSAVGGAIAGAKFGPVGAGIGAVVSGATTIINQYISYQNQIANYEQSLNATRVETVFKAQRAGLYDGGKGTEN